MRSRRAPALTLGLAFLAGCHSHATPPPSSAVTSSPSTSSRARNDAFQAAAKALSKGAHVPYDSIAGVSEEEMTWSDGCLGCARVGESCAQVLTPGFRVVLRAADATYEYHTDMGGHARLCGQSLSPTPSPATPGAAPTPTLR